MEEFPDTQPSVLCPPSLVRRTPLLTSLLSPSLQISFCLLDTMPDNTKVPGLHYLSAPAACTSCFPAHSSEPHFTSVKAFTHRIPCNIANTCRTIPLLTRLNFTSLSSPAITHLIIHHIECNHPTLAHKNCIHILCIQINNAKYCH